jgi:DNA repair protein RecN (Recombination protein N)
MLCEIKIENVAVIEKAAAVFSDGLNVLSGETGAGKSILIDSINAILGNRTSREIVRSHTPKAMIWATFRGIGAKTRAQLADAGYEAENELLLYREITAEGKALAASTACRQQRLWCATSAVDLSTFMASTTIRA